MLVAGEPTDLVADLEHRLEDLERLADPVARDAATAAIQALVELYGCGLERIVAEIAARDDGAMAQALADDDLVAHLLLLHGLHPVPLEVRVRDALGEVRPYLESHGGDVELLAVDPPEVHLRLEGSCSGCPSSAMTLKLAIENAIRKAAPEIEAVVADPGLTPTPGELLHIEHHGEWTMAGGLPELATSTTVVKPVAGRRILFLRLTGGLYAYEPTCPGCGADLAKAEMHAPGELTCHRCGNRYDAMRAGRCLDAPRLHLEPVPLLEGRDGLIKVAV
jgi:Fe-S cluster biogenesis protein NfuA/nitrite reductase/ring-hydroxylating ferredoxin subunit